MLDILDEGLLDDLASTNSGGKGGVRTPLGRVSGSRLLHHLVDLLQGQTLGLGDEEVGVDKGAGAETTPDEEDGRLEVAAVLADHVGSDDSNDGVPEPVGGGGQTDTTRSDGEREDLANDDPGTGTPGGGEEEDEDGDEGDLSVDGRDVVGDAGIRISLGGGGVGVVEADGDTNDGDEELADEHTQGTEDENLASAESLDSPEGEGSRADVDEGEDEGDEERVFNGTSGLEEGGGVVEDEVDTGPLLHHLERGTEDGSSKVGLGGPETALEAVGPAAEPGGVGDQSTLVLLVGNNLSNLSLDELGVLGLAADARQGVNGSRDITLLDVVSWGVGEEEETTTEDDSPGELETDGDAVGVGAVEALGAVDDARGEKETNGDAELVTGDEGTTNLFGALQRG